MFSVELEIKERAAIFSLPPCLDLAVVADLCEYLGCYLAPFNPRQLGNQIIFSLPSEPTDRQAQRFVKALKIHADCWFACYPKKLEEKKTELAEMGKHLRVVPNP